MSERYRREIQLAYWELSHFFVLVVLTFGGLVTTGLVVLLHIAGIHQPFAYVLCWLAVGYRVWRLQRWAFAPWDDALQGRRRDL